MAAAIGGGDCEGDFELPKIERASNATAGDRHEQGLKAVGGVNR
jgi:hypothetical protein